jgi:hypothetical protein
VDVTSFPGGGNPPFVSYTTIAIDATGGVHYAFPEAFTQQITYEEPAGSSWNQSFLDPDAFTVDGGASYKANAPLLAIGKVGGNEVVYLGYTVMAPSGFNFKEFEGRFGTKNARGWTFETVPGFPVAVRADERGAPVVATRSQLLERQGTTWVSIGAPKPGANITDLDVDTAGARYVASIDGATGKVFASRRAGGSWTSEEVATDLTAAVAKIAVANGTIHVGYLTNTGIYYARRDGSTWAVHHVTSDTMIQLAMSVESCGTPHFVGGFVNNTATRYYRWATGSWHSVDVDSPGCNFGDGVDLELTASDAILSFFNCPFMLSRIALR